MKKTSLWLTIPTFVLCLGIMIFGVYSALSVNLNINASLGFNMHDCMVTVQGTIFNLASRPADQNYANRVDRPIERTIMGGEEETNVNFPLDDMYFYYGAYTDSEGTTTAQVYDIVFELIFINISETSIKATFPKPTVGSGVSILHNTNGYTDFSSDYIIRIDQYKSVTVKFALELTNSDNILESIPFSWDNIHFEEYVPQGYTVTITADYPYGNYVSLGYIINYGEEIVFPSTSFTLSNVEYIQFVQVHTNEYSDKSQNGSSGNDNHISTLTVSSTPTLSINFTQYNDSSNFIIITEATSFTFNLTWQNLPPSPLPE